MKTRVQGPRRSPAASFAAPLASLNGAGSCCHLTATAVAGQKVPSNYLHFKQRQLSLIIIIPKTLKLSTKLAVLQIP